MVANIGLMMGVAGGDEGRPALWWSLAGLGGGVLMQAGAMAMALVGVRRARADGRPPSLKFGWANGVGGLILLSVMRNDFLFCAIVNPNSISFSIASGSSLRGLSAVSIALSLCSQAACAIIGRLVVSRSPPQPITVINCCPLTRNWLMVANTFINASGVCA